MSTSSLRVLDGEVWIRGRDGATFPAVDTPPPTSGGTGRAVNVPAGANYTPGVGVFNPLTHDWTTSGIEAGTTLTPYAGPSTISANDTVYEGVNLSASSVTISGDRSGFRNSQFTKSVILAGGSFGLMEHCTTPSHPALQVFGGVDASGVVRYCDIDPDLVDGVRITWDGVNDSIVEYNIIWRDNPVYAGASNNPEHHDGIQVWEGGHITIRRNWIDGYLHTSCILVKPDLGATSGILIEENYLNSVYVPSPSAGGFYAMQIRSSTGSGGTYPEYVTVRNNVFGPDMGASHVLIDPSNHHFCRTEAERDAAVAGGDATAKRWIVWEENNYNWDGTLATVPYTKP